MTRMYQKRGNSLVPLHIGGEAGPQGPPGPAGADFFPGFVAPYYGELDDSGRHPLVNGTALTQWRVCDGSDGTPDMRDRVPLGVSASKARGSKGGSATHNHTVSVSVGAHAASAVSGGTGSGGNVSASGNTGSSTPSITVSMGNTTARGTVGATTLSIAQMPSHTHDSGAGPMNGIGYYGGGYGGYSSNGVHVTSGATGGSGSHGHTFTGSAHTHTVSTSGGAHSHTVSVSGGAHSHGAGTLKTPQLTHSASGSSGSASTLQPYLALHFIIYVG